MSKNKLKKLQDNRIYPEETAGAMMATQFTRLTADLTIAEAFQKLRESDELFEDIFYCYVCDEDNVLQGTISVREIFASDDKEIVRDVMSDFDELIVVDPYTDQEEVAMLFDRYDYLAVPVVDVAHRLLGVITIDDALDIMRVEVSEDLTKMASVQPEKTPYLETTVFRHARSRIVWLIILTFSGLLNEGLLNQFDDIFLALPVLVSYIPMLTDTGGNVGSQSSSVVIRSLALGEITTEDAWQVILKELAIGFCVGIAMAVVNLLRIIYFEGQEFLVALTVSFTLLGVAMVAKALGAALPMLAEKLNIDSAVMAGPLIATISDGVGILIYFSLANLILF